MPTDFLDHVISVAQVALVVLVISDDNVLSDIALGDRFDERLHASVVINQIGIVGFTIHNASSGVVIEINTVLTPVVLIPDVVMAVRVVEKISVGFSVR